MLQETRLAIALTLSVAAHASAGIGAWFAVQNGGQRGTASTTTLAAILVEAEPSSDSALTSQKIAEIPVRSSAVPVEQSRVMPEPPESVAQSQAHRIHARASVQEPSTTGVEDRPQFKTDPDTELNPGTEPRISADSEPEQASRTAAATARREPTPDRAEPYSDIASLSVEGSESGHIAGNDPDAAEKERYWDELAAWIKRHKRYPRSARQRRQQGVVNLGFVMDRKGRVTSIEIIRSSGIPSLDREAARMLQRAVPLPVAPGHIADHDLQVAIPIDFQLP